MSALSGNSKLSRYPFLDEVTNDVFSWYSVILQGVPLLIPEKMICSACYQRDHLPPVELICKLLPNHFYYFSIVRGKDLNIRLQFFPFWILVKRDHCLIWKTYSICYPSTWKYNLGWTWVGIFPLPTLVVLLKLFEISFWMWLQLSLLLLLEMLFSDQVGKLIFSAL